MFKHTIYTEQSRSNPHGYTEILWKCHACGHQITLPQQQNFKYCLHCGAKVVTKVGGNVNPRP